MFQLVVLLCGAVGLAAAAPSAGLGLAYGGVVAAPVSSVSQYSSSVLHGAPLAAYGAGVLPYGGYTALAQAPHSPALVLDAVHGVPLDTPEVVAARAAHYQAKALSLHHLRKRSLAYASPVLSPYSAPLVSAYSSPLVSTYSAPVVSPYSSPLVSAYSAPLVSSPLAYHSVGPKALSVHPW